MGFFTTSRNLICSRLYVEPLRVPSLLPKGTACASHPINFGARDQGARWTRLPDLVAALEDGHATPRNSPIPP